MEIISLKRLEFTICSGTQEADDKHPHHDRCGESQQQQEQHADQHGYYKATNREKWQK